MGRGAQSRLGGKVIKVMRKVTRKGPEEVGYHKKVQE